MYMENSIKKHIFILDDEPKVREAIRETLEVSNYKVSCFGDHILQKIKSILEEKLMFT
jgi:DNA-binding response OmpR family regulator